MEEVVTLKEAREQIRIAMTRIALLHLAFSKTLVEEYGETVGKQLILKAIMKYGKLIGERVKLGLPDMPKFGIHENRDGKVYDCILAKVFREYQKLDLGCLYCYVDPSKSMAANPSRKRIHKDCAAAGDNYCTFEIEPTTEKEREDFLAGNQDWKYTDPRLVQGVSKVTVLK